MTRVLLTSFEPFGGRSVNASAILSDAAMGRLARGQAALVHHARLPVHHQRAAVEIGRLIGRLCPARVVLTGEWSGTAVRLERHARPGPLAPWRGGVVTPQPGPCPAPFSFRGMAPRQSGDAGRYVCDTTFWAAAEAVRRPGTAVMFVHVPRDVTEPRSPRGRAIADALRALLLGAPA